MKTIKLERAKELASFWHQGQWSALYQFASSGVYLEENALHYLKEIENNLHPDYDLFPRPLTQLETKELTALKNWFLRNGVKVEYRKDETYGYLTPYLLEPNDGVKPLGYLK